MGFPPLFWYLFFPNSVWLGFVLIVYLCRPQSTAKKRLFTLALQKSRMPEMQGVKREAVVVYADPLTTQQMRYPRLSRRVNNITVFPGFLDITHSGLQDMAQ
jgi:hypothetical protein